MWRSMLAVLLLGCQGGSDDDGSADGVDADGGTTDTDQVDTDGGDPTGPTGPTGHTGGDTGPTGDTGTAPPYPEPTRLEVDCVPDANPMRFTCTVDVEPAQPVQVRFSRADGLSVERIHTGDDEVIQHTIPLYFMASDQDYDVAASATTWPDDEVSTTVTTGLPPSSVASYMAMTGTSTMNLIGSHLPCNSDAVGVVYDTNTGDLVWFENIDNDGTLGILDMIQFTEDKTVLGESDGDLIEVDLMGQDIVRLNNLDDVIGAQGCCGFHHDVFKRNGVYYLMYQEDYGGSGWFADVVDEVVIVDASGTLLATWDPLVHLPIPPNWGGDFLHTNTIYVDEQGDIYLSWLEQSTIGKIDGDWTSPTFGTPIWTLLGSAGGQIGNTITTDWSPIASNRSSFSFQHSLNVRSDGRVTLLDNDGGRGLVIAVDEATNTATVDGAYPTVENSCGAQGTTRATQAGNPVVGCLGNQVREYDITTGGLLWEADVDCAQGGGGGWGSLGGAARWYPLDGW